MSDVGLLQVKSLLYNTQHFSLHTKSVHKKKLREVAIATPFDFLFKLISKSEIGEVAIATPIRFRFSKSVNKAGEVARPQAGKKAVRKFAGTSAQGQGLEGRHDAASPSSITIGRLVTERTP